MPRLNSMARLIHTTLQIVASLTETVCALRWNTPKSSASIASTNRLNPTHIQIIPIGLRSCKLDRGAIKKRDPTATSVVMVSPVVPRHVQLAESNTASPRHPSVLTTNWLAGCEWLLPYLCKRIPYCTVYVNT